MTRGSRSLRGAAALLWLCSAACTSAKGRAEADLATADRALAALPEDAPQVMPEELAPLTDAVSQGRQQLAQGDYAGASLRVREVPAQARLLADSLPARRVEITATLDTLAVAMPRNLAAIKAKLDTIARGRRLPRGLDEQELQEAKDVYPAATAEWADIMTAFRAGALADASNRALALKNRVTHSLLALGLVSDERAWSNVTLPPK